MYLIENVNIKDFTPSLTKCRGISILAEVRNVEISRVTQHLCSKYHDFQAIFDLAHSNINQIA